jgi:hypothetical protein
LRLGSITKRWFGGTLAPAEICGASLCGRVLEGRESASLVGTIAKGLVSALAAGAPPVSLVGFNLNCEGACLGDYRVVNQSLHSEGVGVGKEGSVGGS